MTNNQFVIIAGFGLPGRSVAEFCRTRGLEHCIVERNEQTVERCSRVGVPIIQGDVREEQTLIRAGIERATMMAITLPEEVDVLAVTEQARRLNPTMRIVARCMFTSVGLKAANLGADEVIVGEQVIAREFSRLVAAEMDRRG